MVATIRLKCTNRFDFLLLLIVSASSVGLLVSSVSAFQSNANNLSFRPSLLKKTATEYSLTPRPMSHAAQSKDVWSVDQLMEYATHQGINMSLSTLGPGYRAVARSTQNASQILGYCEGFVRPTGNVLHLDKMEVFQKVVIQVKKDNPDFVKGGTLFGPGLMLGFLCLLHGRSKGCTTAEFLAIDDEEKQHRRLVRYYERSGFRIVKYVGDDFSDIPARMVWGGCGTLMEEDIHTLLLQWTAMLNDAGKRA